MSRHYRYLPALLLVSGLALAGCSSTAVGSATPAPATSTSPATTPAAEPSGSALHYVKIVEPFSTPGRCKADGNTLEMTACLLKQVQAADQRVDSLQRKRFEQADPGDRADLLADDAKWLKQRVTTCSANRTGGTIDQINAADCLLTAGQTRAKALATSA